MTTEELLQPRFKVISPYPCSIHKLGDIILTYKSAMSYAVQIDDVSEKICLEDYPNIFKKLKWFEDREIEDLPEYLKDKNEIYKVYKYDLSYSMFSVKVYEKSGYILTLFLYNVLPSNKEEYEANKNI